MTDRAKDRLSEMADTLIEKASKRWIEDVGDGFSCNLDLLREEILFHLKAGYALGRADENEAIAKLLKALCGVNPSDVRPCVDHLDERSRCPVCSKIGEIRSRLSGEDKK